ncbi:MAG: sulfatase/phosphatase domain-containing protein [Opitutales bacterium]
MVYDLFPTVLSVTRIESKELLDGVDLSSFLEGELSKQEPEFLIHFPHNHRSSYYTAYRLGVWKVVYHYYKKGEDRYELFNLKKDRDESNNVAAKARKRLRSMMRAMIDALQDAGAQYASSLEDTAIERRPDLP